MHRRPNSITVAVVILGLLAAGCGGTASGAGSPDPAAEHSEPASVEPIGDTGLARLTLTEDAAERIGLETASVTADENGRPVVPYGALIYTPDGSVWVYTTSKPLEFVRHSVRVAEITGNTALLNDGPDAGVEVVTVGAAELLGTEFGVDH